MAERPDRRARRNPMRQPALDPAFSQCTRALTQRMTRIGAPCISTTIHTLSHRNRAVWADGVKTGRLHSFAAPHGDRAPVLMPSAQTASLDRSNGSLRRVGDVTQSPPSRSPALSFSSSHWLKAASRAGRWPCGALNPCGYPLRDPALSQCIPAARQRMAKYGASETTSSSSHTFSCRSHPNDEGFLSRAVLISQRMLPAAIPFPGSSSRGTAREEDNSAD